ncbi:MAG: hypothetical protein QOJ99_5352 [Bryobacterales bacterium]|jgi:hypothetical protein|nr:hypothetical protein [Bryobacterales bacterium]
MSPAEALVDAQLVQIASNPLNTIPGVIAAFEAIDRALPESDGLKWFNQLYLNVTRAVDQSISGLHWNNTAWLARLDVLFARLYLNALRASLTPGQTAPGCWQVMYGARSDARLARIQFAFAGMNAHIDHDLSVAVVETCAEFGIVPVHRSPEYRDYTQVNQILDSMIDATKRQLMVGLLGNSLPCIGRVEDLAGGFGILAAREIAWTNAELLWHARSIPGLANRFLDGLDRAATLAGTGLLAPVGV